MIFTPFFTVVYIQKQLILQTINVLNKKLFKKIHSFKSRPNYNGAHIVILQVNSRDPTTNFETMNPEFL